MATICPKATNQPTLLGTLSSERPRSGLAFSAELIWAIAAMFGGTRLAAALDTLSVRIIRENQHQTADHVQAQWRAGWADQQREAEQLNELVCRA
jgi:hypothetical protein